MSARQDDNRRIGEIWHVIQQLKRRMAESNMTQEQFLAPQTALEEMAVDGLLYSLFRVTEEAAALSDRTKIEFPDIAWDAIRGLRNRLAHDYPGTDHVSIWHALVHDLDELEMMCIAYAERRNLNLAQLTGPDAARSPEALQ